ncbi:hypothetical protein SFR_3597 [Streptomyces sp. FR-008]|nr:hypothetical protein SFR_3597 [Streptomyces sp. FR-008]
MLAALALLAVVCLVVLLVLLLRRAGPGRSPRRAGHG